jgi:6-phosphogluconolactonase
MSEPDTPVTDQTRTVSPTMAGGGYQIVTRPESFAATAAAFIGHKLRAMSELETISVALSGGSTPGPVYERLAMEPELPWPRVRIFFADERAVPPDHPASNYKLAADTLLARVPVNAEWVHRMEAERPDIDVAAAAYDRLLPSRLDLLILGIGEDGHTASLFPDEPALSERTRRVLPARAPSEPAQRMTITPPVIQLARLVILLASGPSKAGAVRRAFAESARPSRCPARLARRGVWILDRDAIAQLPNR